MNKLRLLLLLSYLILGKCAFAQKDIDKTSANGYLDSATFYLEKFSSAREIDTTIFEKAVGYLWMAELDSSDLVDLDAIGNQLYRKGRKEYSEALFMGLVYKLTQSENRDLAIKYCKDIIDNYDASQRMDDRAVALNALTELRKPLRSRSVTEAFEYYTSRLKIYLPKRDSSGISISYFCMGTTYRLIGLPDMAIYNFKKSIAYINKADTLTTYPISGLGGWMNNTSVLGQLYLEVDDYRTSIKYSNEARVVRINILKDPNVSYLNGNIAYAKIKLNELDGVSDLIRASIQLANAYEDYPSLVRAYEIQGQYFLAMNQADSAEASLIRCKQEMLKHNVPHFSGAGNHTPNYFLALIRISQNRLQEARFLLESEIPQVSSIIKELLKEQKLLVEVYNKLGDCTAADSLFKQFVQLQSFISSEERKNRTISYEIEAKIEIAENTINNLVTEKRIADITRQYLIGVAVLLMVVVAVIFNRFRVTRKQKKIIEKEKQRSDELLLNILPEEVAAELKDKGSAEARHFDTVTVMFTDFKGFTQIAEKLTPAELVNEIDTCFKAFDKIITKYNIEKIKTIGDAYMCAGGLPVENKSHARDVIRAALEIQQYMADHMTERRHLSKEVFEIRIGIHSGPVVAGIVGIRKFAYDIWGDTVNIASRMESSGESGKVNISEATYALVKDEFRCVPRGKIQAKNKGEIEMYFVEG